MIFSQKDLNFSILDVMAFESGNVVCHNKKRSYCALSLRIKSDAQIIHKGKVTNLSDGAVTYFPAETDYIRKSKYDKLIAVHLNVQNYISYEIQSVKPENSDEIYSIFNDMLTVWTQKKTGYKYTACALLYKLFGKFCIEFSDDAAIPDSIRNALDFIHENYTDCKMRIQNIAKQAGMSEVYFRKIFKNSLNVTPKKYIDDLKIEYAKSLLNSGQVTVAEAAERAGFCDVKHFSTAFKKKTGIPPSRQQYKE